MRSVLMITAVLACAVPATAQVAQPRVPDKNLQAVPSPSQVQGRPLFPGSAPSSNAEVAPDVAVVTLDGVCDPPHASTKKSPCKTIVTRGQLDTLMDLLIPAAPEATRRQFAVNYARLLAASSIADRQHLDKDPATARTLQIKTKFVRMQVLSDALYRNFEQQAASVPPSEIQKYYAAHLAEYEEADVLRISLPKKAHTSDGLPLDPIALKTKAEELRLRAAAGDDFDQLQQTAYKDLGILSAPPESKLNNVRRVNLSSNEAAVFSLQPGEISEIHDWQDGLVILKLVSKRSASLQAVQQEIASLLRQQRMQQELQNAASTIKGDFNLAYLETPSAPDLFPLPGTARTSPSLARTADSRSRPTTRRRKPATLPTMPAAPAGAPANPAPPAR